MENAIPTEVELKLAISPKHVSSLVSHPLLAARTPERRRLENTYFDTAAGELAAQRIALRLRRIDDQRLMTVKTAGQGSGGLSQREEWEWPIDGDSLALDDLRALPPFQGALATALDELTPALRTDFNRTLWLVEWQQSRIEVVLDEGEIEKQTRQTSICEVELELKSGDADDLWSLALALAEQTPLRPSDASKAARGNALAAADWPLPEANTPAQWLHRATAALDAFNDSTLVEHLLAAKDALATLAAHPALSDELRPLAKALMQALNAQGEVSTSYGQHALTLAHRLAYQTGLR